MFSPHDTNLNSVVSLLHALVKLRRLASDNWLWKVKRKTFTKLLSLFPVQQMTVLVVSKKMTFLAKYIWWFSYFNIYWYKLENFQLKGNLNSRALTGWGLGQLDGWVELNSNIRLSYSKGKVKGYLPSICLGLIKL